MYDIVVFRQNVFFLLQGQLMSLKIGFFTSAPPPPPKPLPMASPPAPFITPHPPPPPSLSLSLLLWLVENIRKYYLYPE